MECGGAKGSINALVILTKCMNPKLDLLSPDGLASLPLFDRSGLLKAVLAQFRISRHGVHGPSHWARVRSHGFTVGNATGADLLVVELFAFLHDSQRENEGVDPNHGSRAAEYASSLNRGYFDLNGDQLDMLCLAMRGHSDGGIHPEATIQTCWDADRLDLGRVGTKPKARYLSIEGIKHIEEAYAWSLK
jgi:uncharacterized protein